MFVLVFYPAVIAILLLPGVVNLLVLRHWNPDWWRRRPVRIAARLVPLLGLACGLAWIAGHGRHDAVFPLLGRVSFGLLVTQLLVLGALAAAGLATRLGAEGLRGRRVTDPGRRRFVQGAAALLPLAAAGAGVGGTAGAGRTTRVFVHPVACPGLPPDLAGLRILQLSDLHLAGFVTLTDLEGILARALPLRPDLVAVTGDLADDTTQLPDALAMIADLGAPLGAVMICGNHEHGNGIATFRAAAARSRVELLVDAATVRRRGEALLRIEGIDDPRGDPVRESRDRFFARALDAAARGRAPSGPHDDEDGHAFRLLLSHRPGVLPHAAARGHHLVLAGHTHGGQLGWRGRSLVQLDRDLAWPWGLYREGGTRMYVTSGAGHWIPFRLGCPTEAPVHELRRA